MKRFKLIYLLPFGALLLSGCSLSQIREKVDSTWIGQHVWHPFYDPIKKWIDDGKKDVHDQEEKKEEVELSYLFPDHLEQ